MRVLRTAILILTTSLLLAACGFHLRGEASMPFSSLYIDAGNPGSALVAELRRNLEVNHIKLTDKATEADVVLNIVYDLPERQILTLGGSGRVNEFQLTYRVSLRAYDQQQRVWIPANELVLSRDYSYDDTKLLAKEAEEALLYQNMRADMVQQIMRRLSHAKPINPPEK